MTVAIQEQWIPDEVWDNCVLTEDEMAEIQDRLRQIVFELAGAHYPVRYVLGLGQSVTAWVDGHHATFVAIDQLDPHTLSTVDEAPGMTLDELLGRIDDVTGDTDE